MVKNRTTKRPSKYHSKRIYDAEVGRYFDSMREQRRYHELHDMEQRGEIQDLQMQVRFELIPPVYGEPGPRGGKPKLLERGADYIADFVYTDQNSVEHVEDVKGYRTDTYKLKRKMFRYRYGKSIEEV